MPGLSVGYNTANMAYVWDPKKKKNSNTMQTWLKNDKKLIAPKI